MKNEIFLILFLSAIISCDDKSCDDVVCGVNQNCFKGNCLCINGYEGQDCQDLAADKYIGDFNISQSCSQGSGTFVTFGSVQTDGSPVNELLFYNFLGLGQTAYAYIGTDQSGNGNYIQFPTQNLGAAEIAGEGYYQDYGGSGRISIDIQLTLNNQLSYCNYTYY